MIGDLAWLWLLLLAAALIALAALAVRAAAKRRATRRWLLAAAAATSVLIALVSTAGAALQLLFFNPGNQRVIAVSPDHRFHLVIHEDTSLLDPVHGLYVETATAPFAERTYFGCVNGDVDGNLLASGRFPTPTTIQVRTKSGHQWTLRFNPKTVQALTTLPKAACGKQLYTG